MLGITGWIEAGGYLGFAAAVFAETGLMVGAFLPGDTLIVTAGFLAHRGVLSFWILAATLTPAAVVGDATGYLIGRRAGRRFLRGQEEHPRRAKHLRRAQRFFARHGGKAVFAARFVGFLRTFVPVIAGVFEMPVARFLVFNVAGGACWITSMLALGYFGGAAALRLGF